MNLKGSILLLVGIFLFFQSCYSFTGSSLDERIKTVQISKFPNYAPLQNPNLSQDFTTSLQDRFDRRTKLTLVSTDDADMLISGEITGYDVSAVTVVSGDRAAQNRLTIRIKVQYENNIQPDKSFERTFSDYEDFPQGATLDQVQDELVELINLRLIDQIFNAIVADW